MFFSVRLAKAATSVGKHKANYQNSRIITANLRELDLLKEENRLLAVKIEEQRNLAKFLKECKEWLKSQQ